MGKLTVEEVKVMMLLGTLKEDGNRRSIHSVASQLSISVDEVRSIQSRAFEKMVRIGESFLLEAARSGRSEGRGFIGLRITVGQRRFLIYCNQKGGYPPGVRLGERFIPDLNEEIEYEGLVCGELDLASGTIIDWCSREKRK